uniref:Uncharacterized protein n=1 Tax=Oryza glumipatula TaxID=40148 RepID=A0A0D9ZTY0_9ORYZ
MGDSWMEREREEGGRQDPEDKIGGDARFADAADRSKINQPRWRSGNVKGGECTCSAAAVAWAPLNVGLGRQYHEMSANWRRPCLTLTWAIDPHAAASRDPCAVFFHPTTACIYRSGCGGFSGRHVAMPTATARRPAAAEGAARLREPAIKWAD